MFSVLCASIHVFYWCFFSIIRFFRCFALRDFLIFLSVRDWLCVFVVIFFNKINFECKCIQRSSSICADRIKNHTTGWHDCCTSVFSFCDKSSIHFSLEFPIQSNRCSCGGNDTGQRTEVYHLNTLSVYFYAHVFTVFTYYMLLFSW